MSEISKETFNRALHEMNERMIAMFGVPKKFKKDPCKYGGHLALVFKWLKENDIQYLYFVINDVFEYVMRSGSTITIGYLLSAIGNRKDKYDPEKNILPAGASKADLLRSGYCVENLPDYVLTAKERRERRQSLNSTAISPGLLNLLNRSGK